MQETNVLNVIDAEVAKNIGYLRAKKKYWRQNNLRQSNLYSNLGPIFPVEAQCKAEIIAADFEGAVDARALVISKGKEDDRYYARKIASCELDMQLNKAMVEVPTYGQKFRAWKIFLKSCEFFTGKSVAQPNGLFSSMGTRIEHRELKSCISYLNYATYISIYGNIFLIREYISL